MIDGLEVTYKGVPVPEDLHLAAIHAPEAPNDHDDGLIFEGWSRGVDAAQAFYLSDGSEPGPVEQPPTEAPKNTAYAGPTYVAANFTLKALGYGQDVVCGRSSCGHRPFTHEFDKPSNRFVCLAPGCGCDAFLNGAYTVVPGA